MPSHIAGLAAPGAPKVNPAVALEGLRGAGPAAYPPGFYGTIRTRLPVFALVGALSLFLGLIPFNHHRTMELVLAGTAFLLLTLLSLVIPWSRVPPWCWAVVPIGYIGVIALVRDAQGGASAGLTVLYLLPVVWIAFYGRRSHLVAGLVALALAFAIPMAVVGAPGYPFSEWREALVTMVVAVLVTFTFLTMVARDRAYVADLAAQSLYARSSAEQAMRAREQLDSLLQAATETAIIGTDARGVITFFSTGAERMLGMSARDVVGRIVVDALIEPHERSARRLELAGLLALAPGTPATPPLEESIWTYVRSDGTARRAAVTVTTRPDPGHGTGLVLVASDVTEREQLAFERERLLAVQREVTQVLVEQNHRLRELTQMKDDVVATVSHELRTPLTSIRGFVELLMDDPERFDAEQIRMLRTIDRNSLQLLRVAEDLLADPGGGHGLRVDFVDTDVTTIATHAAEAMHAVATRQHTDVVLLVDASVIVNGDPSRLHQLLDNLLANAVKFTGAGGHVCLRVTTVGRYAQIDVLDDGPGIPAAEREQLFERFYRLASSTNQGIPGTGLGLAIAKSVVEAHDGTIEIVDTPGWSTTFRVLLPLVELAKPADPLLEAQSVLDLGAPLTIGEASA